MKFNILDQGDFKEICHSILHTHMYVNNNLYDIFCCFADVTLTTFVTIN